ncbi:MAG TPA: hypothetical protein VFQ84_13910 [Arenimonas sp.]|uniref:hypothetical protein n=1 Tax=Arenimonas sp. TaxID=1872635 RepID=UPI002D7F7286|nr:hypothetical protein [Arenimonas sp.]HEU0154418.1 hypothetical protein [Arenimonas sp.]
MADLSRTTCDVGPASWSTSEGAGMSSTQLPFSEVSYRSHPNNWFNRASDLHASAGAIWLAMESGRASAQALGLWQGFDMTVACRPVYHLLSGLSLEVLMKGVLAERGAAPELTHNLLELAKALPLELLDGEPELLRYYSDTVIWAAKYPVPTRPTDEKLAAFYSNAVEVLTDSVPGAAFSPKLPVYRVSSSGRADWEPFNNLYGRIFALRHAQ